MLKRLMLKMPQEIVKSDSIVPHQNRVYLIFRKRVKVWMRYRNY